MHSLNDHATQHLQATSGEMMSLVEEEEDLETTGIFNQVVTLLRSLSNVLPQATKTLKFARLEVSKLAANLDGLFRPFQTMGPDLFGTFSSLYRTIWTLYFCLMVPLSVILTIYGFWAGGFFGGPGNAAMEEEPKEDQTPQNERGIAWKIRTCCSKCCTCLHGCHDMSLSFWGCIITMQFFVMIMFVVALVLLIMAAIQRFVS